MEIHAATEAGFEQIRAIFQPIVASARCEHAQGLARKLGYRALLFNLVATTNRRAIRLRTRLGFETVGRLPRAFDHPTHGEVDALAIYKWLAA